MLSYGVWHTIVIWVEDNRINCEIDRGPVNSYIDNGQIINDGGVAFETLDDSAALIDNVVVFPYDKRFQGWIFGHELPVPEDEVNSGGMQIWSIPSGARIWVDGEYTGKRTPDNVPTMDGEHKVELTKEGYISSSDDVIVPTVGIQLTYNLRKNN